MRASFALMIFALAIVFDAAFAVSCFVIIKLDIDRCSAAQHF